MTDLAPASPSDTTHAVVDALERLLVSVRSHVDVSALERHAKEGLTFSQARVLMTVGEADEPLPINVIAERLELSVAAAGRNVDQLVKDRMLKRVECPHDRRVRLVSVTAAGRRHVDGKRGIWRDAFQGMAASLPQPVAARLAEALNDALAHQQQGKEPA